jgi:hypothetical protein
MSVNNADRARHITRTEWKALREQCERALGISAELCAEARQAKSEAVEQRILRGAGGGPTRPSELRPRAGT